MSSEGLHERFEDLSDETRDRHRAIASLMEELEAVDWYQQRADATRDPELKRILEHNRDEEMEHAAMVLEWLRRTWPKADEELRTYLFTTGSITGQEEAATGKAGDAGSADAEGRGGGGDGRDDDGSLGLGANRTPRP